MTLLKYTIEGNGLEDSGIRFIRYLAVKMCDNNEDLMAYSDISGRLYVPNHPPTFFADIKILRKAIRKSMEYLEKTNPSIGRKTQFLIYKVEFELLN